MTRDVSQQVDVDVTPGSLLRTARLEQGLPEREVADRLNMMPGYVDVLERDAYQELRSPAFARGYVKAYGHLLGLDEDELLRIFDDQRASITEERKRVETSSLQLQSTGVGVVVGLVILLLLFVGLWFWQGQSGKTDTVTVPESALPAENEPAGEQ